jgi:hypothetical protein
MVNGEWETAGTIQDIKGIQGGAYKKSETFKAAKEGTRMTRIGWMTTDVVLLKNRELSLREGV